MIEKLREVHEAEVKKKAIKIQQQQLALKGAQQRTFETCIYSFSFFLLDQIYEKK